MWCYAFRTQIKDFVDTFPKSKQTHRMIEELTCDPSISYSPSVALVVASNPTSIDRLAPVSINTKQQRYCNIKMPIYLNQLN